MNNKGTDQTAQMRRLICVFVVRIWQNRFSHFVAHMRYGASSVLHFREAWKAVGGMEKSQAMFEYIAEVEKHEPQWETKVCFQNQLAYRKRILVASGNSED